MNRFNFKHSHLIKQGRLAQVGRILRPVVLGCMVTASGLLLAGCSNSAGYSAPGNVQGSVRTQQQIGTVSSIQIIPQRDRGAGGGALLGAVLGGVLGNQFGSGTGRALATGAGVVGGVIAGNAIENRQRTADEIYRVTVQLQNGYTQQFDYQQIGNLQPGDRVSIEGGQLFKL